MALIDYSDSDDGERVPDPAPDASVSPPSKRRKVSVPADSSSSSSSNGLPPLPAAFRDLYSSTVRTSTQDDPSLHRGRKRITPHIVGSWPAHVYLEWNPLTAEAKSLDDVVGAARASARHGEAAVVVHSLLQNELGVPLPLHVSLSRPLALPTAQKDAFLDSLILDARKCKVRQFEVRPLDVVWHPNEDRSRWFLVLRLRRPAGDELRTLLGLCNRVAQTYHQPQLYARTEAAINLQETSHRQDTAHDSFHVSLAWTLKPHDHSVGHGAKGTAGELPTPQLEPIRFSKIKVRIGQDVSSISLVAPRPGPEKESE